MIDFDWRKELSSELNNTLSHCTQCGACVKNCSFLQQFGNPFELAENFKNNELTARTVFSCNLCELCTALCPEKLNSARLLWLMRCSYTDRQEVDFKPFRALLIYESLGLSSLLEQFVIPDNCSTVFFPGCALPGTRPLQFELLVRLLKRQIPDIGMVLSCCAKPSHDLGRLSFFEATFSRIQRRFVGKNIKTVLTACPSCYKIFTRYGIGFEVRSIYDVLGKSWPEGRTVEKALATVHDPCNARFSDDQQKDVRNLMVKMGYELTEMKHYGKRTYCCGEGGAAFCVAEDLAVSWAKKRWEEAGDNRMVSYCAGCTGFLGKDRPVSHVVDLIYDHPKTSGGKARVSKSPFTYLNRLKIKGKIKRILT